MYRRVIFLYCIQESDKPNFLFKIFNIIKINENKIILPIMGDETISVKKAEKLAMKTKKILDKTISKKIVISKKIKKQEKYMELLSNYNYEIVDGKWLFEVLSCKALDYVTSKRKLKKQELAISILVNNLSEYMIENIKQIAKEYKRVNIVTNYMEKFKILEEQILQKDGIMITVGNNKKKGLSKSNIILNVDFSSKLINQYNLSENAVIINIWHNVFIEKKRFNGITINNYDIAFKNFDSYDYDFNTKYKACEMYEAQMNKKMPFYEVMKKIQNDKVQITKLIGKNVI